MFLFSYTIVFIMVFPSPLFPDTFTCWGQAKLIGTDISPTASLVKFLYCTPWPLHPRTTSQTTNKNLSSLKLLKWVKAKPIYLASPIPRRRNHHNKPLAPESQLSAPPIPSSIFLAPGKPHPLETKMSSKSTKGKDTKKVT